MQTLLRDRNKRKSRPSRFYNARPLLSQDFPLFPSSDDEEEPFIPADACLGAGAGPGDDQGDDNQIFPELAANVRMASQLVGSQLRRTVEGPPPVIPAPHSRVLPEQYVEEIVRAEYDKTVERHKNGPAEIRRSYMFPTDKPYTCVCTDTACLAELETKEATFAFCLAHDPQVYGEMIQFMAGFWGEDGKIYCKEVGSAEEITAVAQWPKSGRDGSEVKVPQSIKKQYELHGIDEDSQQRREFEQQRDALYEEVQLGWSGLVQGAYHLFPQLDFDNWLHQDSKGKPKAVKEAERCRWYLCPTDGCDFRPCHRAQDVLKHIATNHREYSGKQLIAYKIALTTAGSPDYFFDWKLLSSGHVVPIKQKPSVTTCIGHLIQPSAQPRPDKRSRKPAEVYKPGGDLPQSKPPKVRKTSQSGQTASMMQLLQAQLDWFAEQKEADRKAAAAKEDVDRKSREAKEKEDKQEREAERKSKEAQEEANRQERALERKSREDREKLDRQERAAERAQMRQACEAVLSVAKAVSQNQNEDFGRL